MSEDRRLMVLRAIVQDYVQTSEPVGSKALVERLPLADHRERHAPHRRGPRHRRPARLLRRSHRCGAGAARVGRGAGRGGRRW